MSDPSIQRLLRDAAGRFATGITVVTTTVETDAHGMTANGFMSVSLDPPLVAVSIAKKARMRPLIERSGTYGVSILGSEQRDLSSHFAGRPLDSANPVFVEVDGVPLLEGAVAHIAAMVTDAHPAGDHILFIGEVTHLALGDGQPLIFHGGNYRALQPELHWTWYGELGW